MLLLLLLLLIVITVSLFSFNVAEQNEMGDYRYHELRPLISYFPFHWVVRKILRIFYRIIARYGRDIYTLTQSFPNQQ